ncbi:hypothetical protein [Streptomyces sp. NPDC053431]|uniref:hypothetical protein n=1 Tax=Streptomyces sp. NPDC053431 TaxID=3365703 RepID=UPI0037D61E89
MGKLKAMAGALAAAAAVISMSAGTAQATDYSANSTFHKNEGSCKTQIDAFGHGATVCQSNYTFSGWGPGWSEAAAAMNWRKNQTLTAEYADNSKIPAGKTLSGASCSAMFRSGWASEGKFGEYWKYSNWTFNCTYTF